MGLPLPSPLLRRRGRRGRPPLRLRPGCSTGPTATGPSATVTLPTATLLTPTPATTATTAGRRGKQLPRLTLRLHLRPIPGCCTVATDSPTVGTTATATTTLPMLTSEAAATTLVDLSLALVDKREAINERSK